MKPLEGIKVLDFSQFLSSPSAALRLADLGASVIKVENPDGGDICRRLYISNCIIDGDSSLFHAINRNKDGITLDLKDKTKRCELEKLIKDTDIIIMNFRPDVSKRLGIDYASATKINPSVIYGEITGYGKKGIWKDKPGQDLLVQALSGLAQLNGDSANPPTPFGLSVADMFAGQHLVQGILAALIKKAQTNEGSLIHVSLLESILDVQFEVFTTFLNDGHELPKRSSFHNANAYIGAPYGIYETKDGYLAIAMASVPNIGKLISCPELLNYTDSTTLWSKRDEIKQILAKHLKNETTKYWLSILEPADVWCADVFTWDKLFQTEGFKNLDMLQKVKRKNGIELFTTRCPIRIDGEIYKSEKAAPILGQNNKEYL